MASTGTKYQSNDYADIWQDLCCGNEMDLLSSNILVCKICGKVKYDNVRKNKPIH